MDPRRIIFFALAWVGCGGAAAPVETAAPVVGPLVGDYVVYRYAGRIIGVDPMHLMREVVSREGDALVVEVTLTRGHETLRAWRETVNAGALDAVLSACRIEGDTCSPLESPASMYEGLVVVPDGPPTDEVLSDETVELGGVEMTCHVRRTSITHDGEAMGTKDIACPDFVWGNGGAAVEYPDKRRVLRVTVESFG